MLQRFRKTDKDNVVKCTAAGLGKNDFSGSVFSNRPGLMSTMFLSMIWLSNKVV